MEVPKEQVNEVVLPTVCAPVFALQLPVPAVPVIVQIKLPVGATPPVAPVIVAVMISLPPKTALAGFAVTVTVGVADATNVEVEEIVPVTGRYEVSPGYVKVALYVPATDATTVHRYVEVPATLVLGPLVIPHEVTGPTPVIDQTPTPLGATAELGPTTVAVNPIVDPRGLVVSSAVTVTAGSA